MPWPAQVRFLHLAILSAMAVIIIFFYSYVNSTQLLSTASPIRSLITHEMRIFPGNNSAERSSPGVAVVVPVPGAGGGSSADNQPQQQQQHIQAIMHINSVSFDSSCNGNCNGAINNSKGTADLTKGVAAETIYESGHVDDTEAEKLCPNMGKNIKLLIAVTSAPSHDGARLAIRETWGHFALRKDVAIAFMLGSINNETINKRIDLEQEIYGDIIRGKFIDVYDNLTLKTISMLEWVDNYCRKAAFVLKTDDDMFINVPRLLSFVAKHKPEQRVIYGRLAKKWRPVRNKKSKYYISPQQYKPNVFPDFTTGPAYLFPANISKELYVAALNLTYFKLEDVFVTGIVANGLKIKRQHVPEFLNKKVPLSACNVQRGISIHMVKSTEQYDLWKKLHDVAKCK